jgi:hypothetical protein
MNTHNEHVERLLAIYEYIDRLNRTGTIRYDFLLITAMNTFLTTQFGKYVPMQCAFLIGRSPDYTTWYGKIDQVSRFVDRLLTHVNVSTTRLVVDYSSTIDTLKSTMLFDEEHVDVPCDSVQTTYRTSIYHLKCYSHSTSLFSERMFRLHAYDGHEKQPFNIYIAREYAVLMALQSKVMSLDDLARLAVNVTYRDVANDVSM